MSVLRAFAVGLALFVWGLTATAFAAAPSASTSPASSITTSSALLNGAGTPNGEATTGWFRISATNPGTCNDTFGTRVPATSGTALGSGAVSVPYSITTTGLSSGVTYYFCAIVANASGTAFGTVQSFTVPGAPVTTTTGATLVLSTTATLQGSANPVVTSTTGWFRYATTDPGSCNDTFGTRAPTSSGSALGMGNTPVDYTRGITGLLPGTTYYYCAIASNTYGTTFGAVSSFTTPGTTPTASTNSATLLTGSSGQLNGTANPGGDATTGWFRYSTTSPGACNDSFGTRAPATGGTSLGSGNSSVSFNQAISGLSPGVTYYYCAIASNSYGDGFGSVVTFTTPSAPSVTTNAPTSLTATGATLNGAGIPNRAATTGYFRYSATNPGTCNDTFGSRAPVTGGTSLGSGTSSVMFSQAISSLSSATTYYYCAIASNAEGTAFGAVMSFTTLDAPTVTTDPASAVLSSSATLNATVNPNGATTTGWHRYSTTSPGTCNDTFGVRTPTTGGAPLGAGSTDVSHPRAITGLTANTTYYFCAIAQNAYGTTFGAVLSFTTPPAGPAVTTSSATSITGTGAQLNGSANPGGDPTTAWFRYSTTSPGTCNDTFGTRAPTSGGSALGAGTSSVSFNQTIGGLSQGTTYYFCALAMNSVGTSFGNVLSFTTPSAPSAVTNAASSVTASSATLNGAGIANRAATTGYFRYATTNPGTCNDTFGSRAPATGGTSLGSGTSSVTFSQSVTVSPGTTYYYCAIANNSEGTGFGAVLSFTTLASPTVVTNAATLVAATSATLNGTGNPNGATATGYYRYATTDPGTCNDTFGVRAPTSSGTGLGAGTSPVSFPRSIAGLTPNTTYYFCAIANNTFGTSFGAVDSFTTPPQAPIVVTSSVSMLTGATAQLNGSANPGGAASTGWFRYSTTSPGTCNDTFGTRAPASGGTSLGSLNASVAFNEAITGLSQGTTYYVCAIASNSVGTSFGSVISFVTPAPPTVVTNAPTSVTASSATMNGAGIANRAATTGWFRYSTTNPGTCNDSFGSRAPASGGTSLGSGTSSVSFSQSASALSGGTTYYYCAIASNAEGIAFGTVMSFTTLAAPNVTTVAASALTSSGATLNGSANPNGATSTGWYRYATTSPGTCNDTFGTRAPTTAGTGTNLGAGTADVSFPRPIGGLTPNTTYYFCAIAQNSFGIAFGTVLSFTTPAALPVVTTSSATMLTGTTAQLNGSANPGGDATTGWFRYSTVSPGTCNDTFGTRAPASSGASLGSGNASVAYNQAITGLAAGTTYYYCAIAQNSVGTGLGAVQTFVTPSPPTVVTNPATSVASLSATLNGSGNPNRAATTGYFRYATTNPGTCNDTFGSRAPATGGTSLGSGSASVAFSQSIGSLSPGATYYFCAIATSAEGTAFGSVLSFTTLSAPSVTTVAATSITASGATLNGLGNPNGATATGWYRYATTSPGTCNDTFGTRAPTTAGTGTNLGAGTADVSFPRSIAGLTPNTTYYYCAIASNTYGPGFGAVMSFTTPALPPTVSTSSPTMLEGTAAVLRGSANPNGDNTTGWFRYATVSPGTCNDSFGTRAPTSGGTALGGGIASVAYTEMIGGLTPATTYYYCAIASNALGTAFGSVVTFTTPSAPTVTTNAASSVTSTGATLNGAGVAHLTATTGYFRYSATDPGTCNDTFGSRAPVTGGSSLGSGSSSVSFSQSVGSLSSGTTYYYCAIANNMEGTAFGAVLSFTTLAAPTVTTATASSVTSTTATLNGSANPNGASATGWYRYSTTNPGSCNDTFGMRAPATSGTLLGAGMADVPFPRAITGLTPGATYYYCAIASNSAGTGYGSVLSFTALAAAPTVSTNAASGLTTTSATLNGSANPNGASTTGWFRMDTVSPGTCNDTFGTRVPASGGTSLGAGNASVAYSQTVAVTAGTTYYYCALAANSVDTSFGAVRTFTAPAPPTTNTFAATPVTATTATLNGNVNPNGFTTTGWFRYSTTDPGTCSDTFGTRAPSSGGSSLGAGTVATSYGQAITGLSPATTYYFCAIASSSIGTTFGSVLSFTTPAAPPTVTTIAASSIAPTGAVLNATANPNGSSTTGWFRYSTTNPGACNDTFGTRTPTTGGTSLGMGSAASPYSATLTGLTLGQTYYFCALAQNAIGTSVGTVLTFTTTAAPTVTTNAASAITSTGATLNGAANPNAATTTGWFRYSTTDPGACNDTFGTRAPTTGGTALGAGTTPSTYSRALTGLTAGTTYYFCAIASSASGTGFGSVLSFVTPGAPSVTTDPATSITSSGATLHGTANPNSSSATGYFRYATTSPGTCNDTFGTRAPSTGGATLGSGTTPVSYAQPIIGLAGGTTYYYCAIANNAIGTRFGTVSSFTTPASPTVTTSAASSISGAGATLNGSANPNLAAATGWFRYATTSPGTCNDTFGTRTPVSGGASLGAGSSSVPYSQAVSGLTAGTTYYFCAIASNAAGTAFGSVMSFTTPGAPTVTTLAATSVTTTGATLNGSANPNLSDATGWFRFSTTNPGTCNDAFGTRAPTSGAATLGAGSSAVPYSQALTGLAGGTTYYFCAIASNAEGLRFGSVLSFSTPAAPGVTTLAATSVSSAGATLNATGTANGAATTGWFRYAPSDPGACNDTFGTRSPATGGTSLGSGSTATPFSQTLGGLLPGTTYYFCAIAQNGVGTSFGSLLTFTTSAAPTVTTVGASAITSTTATLDGSANPNLNAATGWFRYATSDPGVCNDTFGTRAPATGGTSLGSGSTSVPYSQALTGLTSGATYYYCAIASNSVGTAVGTVRSFTTLAAPTVTTDPASMLSSTGATLRGSANPNASASTGWFRYATTNPGTCDDTFGTRTPASGGTSLGGGSGVVPYQQTLTGLSPLTTYYYCAIASSSVGTGLGTVQSFTTPDAPSVTTSPAAMVMSANAVLGGMANPNLADATGWFRYDTTHPGTCDDTFGVRAPATGGSALGAGGATVAFTQVASGLSPGTTYYFCAIAQNSVGTRFGAVVSFTTSTAPSVTTEAATDVTDASLTLHGSANPNLGDATGWFRYGETDPGTCNDTFGTRAPAMDGTVLGAGDTAVPFSEAITGLRPATTYYFCAIADNPAGTGFGDVMNVTTEAAAPIAVTVAPTDVRVTTATLNGEGTPNGADATGYFRYDTTDPGTCDDTFGTRAPEMDGAALGAGNAAVPFSTMLTGLTPDVVYYYCAVVETSLGRAFGEIMTFAPGSIAPEVVTEAATDVMGGSGTLHGSATANGTDTTAWFRIGDFEPTGCDDTFGRRVPDAAGSAIGADFDPVAFEQEASSLEPNVTYYYCAAASNLGGATFGEVLSFTTPPAPPEVRTGVPMIGMMGMITLNGSADPRNSPTVGWFRYADTDPGACDDTFGTRAPLTGEVTVGDGRSERPFSQVATLTPGMYWVCAIAENEGGVGLGTPVVFVVPEDEVTMDGGCGCRVTGRPAPSRAWLAALAMLAVIVVRRRRRR